MREEIAAELSVKVALTPGGYEPDPNDPLRLIVPRTEPFVVSKRLTTDGYVIETAQPGELWFGSEEELSTADLAALNAVMADHDNTGKTDDQNITDGTDTALDVLETNAYSAETDTAKKAAMIDAIQRWVLTENKRKPKWLITS